MCRWMTFCLKEGKRCIMWDDEKSGFFLVVTPRPAFHPPLQSHSRIMRCMSRTLLTISMQWRYASS